VSDLSQGDLRPAARLAHLRRRALLTYRHLGARTLAYRLLTFPLRATPLRRYVYLGPRAVADRLPARRWYRRHGRPVTVVIPSYRDAEHVEALVASIRRTTRPALVHVVVADDASGPEHVARLRAIDGVQVVASGENRGFAVNVNRGLRAADPRHDVVLLNSDMIALEGWLACLQYAAHREQDVGIVGARLLYPDGRIQFGGTVRNLGAPEWFDHRFRFKPADWGPACVGGEALAVTGACMYVRRTLIERIGLLDEQYPMAYEDVDWCLSAWQAGLRVIYYPAAVLEHHESVTRGTVQGEREAVSQRHFWSRWGDFMNARRVRDEHGRLRIVYVTHDTRVGGGHRQAFEQLNRLSERGHDVRLFTLDAAPDWFALRCPVRTFSDYEALVEELAPLQAIKVATWWQTAAPVWRASVLAGIPVYFVQDHETSYYPDSPRTRWEVLETYRHEFRYLTNSEWNRERLAELGLPCTAVGCGVDVERFAPLADQRRGEPLILAVGRRNPLKNLGLTIAAWRRLAKPRPQLCLFGSEPDCHPGEGASYVTSPTDEDVNRLYNRATVFVATSVHEGFGLPALEAMAAGTAVVCTDADGNRDYCRDGENCLIADADPGSVAGALTRVIADASLRERLERAGRQTALAYAWPAHIDAVEAFFEDVARPERVVLGERPGSGALVDDQQAPLA